jgi:NADH dehydrogenase [ubiquinone] 1 alpha subcomplex assembly factor 7
MFGECLAVWLLNEWLKMGQPRPVQLVELGPGKGTLMSDILRNGHIKEVDGFIN